MGRYENGDPASAEIALRVASYLRNKAGLVLECFFCEPQAKSFDRLHMVVQDYLGRVSSTRSSNHRSEPRTSAPRWNGPVRRGKFTPIHDAWRGGLQGPR